MRCLSPPVISPDPRWFVVAVSDLRPHQLHSRASDHPNEVQAIPTRTLGSDDEPHPDNVATKALSHGELGDMLFGLEEPSEEKLPAVEPRDTQELPKWAVDTGMISEYGLRAPAGFGLRSAVWLSCVSHS